MLRNRNLLVCEVTRSVYLPFNRITSSVFDCVSSFIAINWLINDITNHTTDYQGDNSELINQRICLVDNSIDDNFNTCTIWKIN